MKKRTRRIILGSGAITIILLSLAVYRHRLRAAVPGRHDARYTIVRLKGTPREMGEQHGQTLKPRIQKFCELTLRLTPKPTLEELKPTLKEYEAFIAPEYIQEMRGVAAGAEVDYYAILLINCFYEVVRKPFQCRQIVAFGKATGSGKLIHGRNFDWPDHFNKLSSNTIVFYVKPEKGRSFVHVAYPGFISAFSGSNDAGITVAKNELGTRAEPGEPDCIQIRRVLQYAQTLDEAVDILRKADKSCNYSMMLSSARTRKAVVVARMGERFSVRRPIHSLITNDNTFRGKPGGRSPTDHATHRLARDWHGRITPAVMKALLADRRVMGSTLYSCVFVPEDGYFLIACGRPGAPQTCRFERLELPSSQPDKQTQVETPAAN